MEEERILAVLWASWRHRNEQVSKERTALTKGVIHNVEGLIAFLVYQDVRGERFFLRPILY